jgi:hypothetical protein
MGMSPLRGFKGSFREKNLIGYLMEWHGRGEVSRAEQPDDEGELLESVY